VDSLRDGLEEVHDLIAVFVDVVDLHAGTDAAAPFAARAITELKRLSSAAVISDRELMVAAI
jgi:hypothetical protein